MTGVIFRLKHWKKLIIYSPRTGTCGRRTVTRPWLASLRGTGALGLRRGPYKTSQVGPFCLAASFLWLQQECGLRNLAPVAWHLVKLIHRQETNCQIKWVSSSLPLPSRLACGWDGSAFLPLFFPLLFSRRVAPERSVSSCRRTRGVGFPQEGG